VFSYSSKFFQKEYFGNCLPINEFRTPLRNSGGTPSSQNLPRAFLPSRHLPLLAAWSQRNARNLALFLRLLHDIQHTRVAYRFSPANPEWRRLQSVRFNGNKLGSAGGVSAMDSNSGNCCLSGSGTFTLEPFNMLMSCSALTTPFP